MIVQSWSAVIHSFQEISTSIDRAPHKKTMLTLTDKIFAKQITNELVPSITRQLFLIYLKVNVNSMPLFHKVYVMDVSCSHAIKMLSKCYTNIRLTILANFILAYGCNYKVKDIKPRVSRCNFGIECAKTHL